MNQELWDQCVAFHGPQCPGLAIGFRASEAALYDSIAAALCVNPCVEPGCQFSR